MALEQLYLRTLERTTSYIDIDQVNEVNQLFQNHGLKSTFDVEEELDINHTYNKDDKTNLTDDLLFTLWSELFFNDDSPCYTSIKHSTSRGDEVADAFVFYTINELNGILDKHNHHYRLVPIDNKITKLYLSSKLV